MSDVIFDEEAILAEARQAAELSDFGPDDFRAGLRRLIETYDRNPFTEKGRRRNRRRLVQLREWSRYRRRSDLPRSGTKLARGSRHAP